jgi:hypothetical protein
MATLRRCPCPLKITGVARHRPVLLRLPRRLLLRLDPSKSRKTKEAGQLFYYFDCNTTGFYKIFFFFSISNSVGLQTTTGRHTTSWRRTGEFLGGSRRKKEKKKGGSNKPTPSSSFRIT